MSAIIAGISVFLLLAAAISLLRLVKLAEQWPISGFIALAFALMAANSSLPLYRIVVGDLSPPNITTTLLCLGIAVLMAVGAYFGRPLIKALATSNQALQHREAQLADAQLTAKLGIFTLDFRDDTAWWSDEMYLRYGYEKGEFVPTVETILEIIHPEDRGRARASIDAFRQSTSSEPLEIDCRAMASSDADVRYIHSVFTPEKDNAGRTIRCRAVSQDVTELMRANIEITEREQQHQLLLDSSAVAIYGSDLSGNCTFCNAACLRLLGYENQDDLRGMSMHELIHHTRVDGSPYPVEECRINQALHGQKNIHVDSEVLIRKDGSRFPVEYWSYPVKRNGTTVGCVVTFVDITARK